MSDMKLQDLEIIKLVPQFMQEDYAIIGLSNGINPIVKDITARIELLKTWTEIDKMTSIELDELAHELNIEWYTDTADIDTKKRLIKESDLVHSRLGTKFAVEEIIQSYFETGEVKEWFEYDGEPYHFKVVTSNTSLISTKIDEFLRLLNIVKRESAWLDSILMIMKGSLELYHGSANHDVATETHVMGLPEE